MSEELRRAEDHTAMAKAARAVQTTSRTFWNWVEWHHLDALSVLVITLGLSIKVMDWAMDYGYAVVVGISGMERAAIIAAVLGPWGLAQAAMVKWYMDLKGKRNGNGKGVTP